MYVAFIDFKKAFDTVGHQFMLYKLHVHKMGLGGKTYDLIKDMNTQKNSRYKSKVITAYLNNLAWRWVWPKVILTCLKYF